MRTLQDKIKEADNLVNEINQYFKIQGVYFNTRDNSDLNKLRAQQQKVKDSITKYKVG